ncbi:mas-related G-protein coupled receptor member A8-like [Siniperca chuatsi]|uniref:mas-related G-protein coupled receptor member A8-like n=1 Tax=Siniperca chuatsi TaxID=119488 RepID=UPI001CE1E20C|nr:mas-related G-protein coupled receptor member A8-like [Siniperca chuatsi]
MEDFYINITSQYKSYHHSNITSHYDHDEPKNDDSNKKVYFIMHVAICIIISIGLPLIFVAIHALYSLVRNDHVVPIYAINLHVSDIIKFCCMIGEMAEPEDWKTPNIFSYIHIHCLNTSVYFMACVALERYLVIACPLWYRCRRSIKTSVVVCVVVWVLPLVFLLIVFFLDNTDRVLEISSSVLLLLPFPLFIFFLGGTLKALSPSRVPSDEKRRIVRTLVLVLLTYTLLFLPTIIGFLSKGARDNDNFSNLFVMFDKLSPLADLVLYVFMRKGTIDQNGQ